MSLQGEELAYVIADTYAQSANHGITPELLPGLRKRLNLSPELIRGLTRWLERRCPVCEADLFMLDKESHTVQWCSDDMQHFAFERLCAEEPDANGKYEQHLVFKMQL